MISLNIKDIKSFMSHLLVKDTFDEFLLSEASISTGNTYNINGMINKAFYSSEELNNLPDSEYAVWQAVKPFCFSLIKGNKVPTGMKLIFMLSRLTTEKLLSEAAQQGDSVLSPDEVKGLFLNIIYANDTATIVTGTAFSVFTLDKTTEKVFDKYICSFFDDCGISYDEA